MKMTISLSDKMEDVLNSLSEKGELDFKTKTEIIRKAVYVYSYLVKKHFDEKLKIIGVQNDDKDPRFEDLSALFEV